MIYLRILNSNSLQGFVCRAGSRRYQHAPAKKELVDKLPLHSAFRGIGFVRVNRRRKEKHAPDRCMG